MKPEHAEAVRALKRAQAELDNQLELGATCIGVGWDSRTMRGQRAKIAGAIDVEIARRLVELFAARDKQMRGES